MLLLPLAEAPVPSAEVLLLPSVELAYPAEPACPVPLAVALVPLAAYPVVAFPVAVPSSYPVAAFPVVVPSSYPVAAFPSADSSADLP